MGIENRPGGSRTMLDLPLVTGSGLLH
jgi:hypothetical protein